MRQPHAAQDVRRLGELDVVVADDLYTAASNEDLRLFQAPAVICRPPADAGYTGAPLVGMVAIHGSFLQNPPGQANTIKGKVLILHGSEDVPIPIPKVNALIEELRAAKVDFRYELYSGAGHGFSVPKNNAEVRANIQSMVSTARFLKEVFGAEGAIR